MALRFSSARIGTATRASSIRLSSQLRWNSNPASTDSSRAAPSPSPAAERLLAAYKQQRNTPSLTSPAAERLLSAYKQQQNTPSLRKFVQTPAVLKLPSHSMGDWVKERAPYIVNTYAKPDIVFARGKGPYLWDLEQNQYIDFTSGIGVCALGHADERIAKIIADQANLLLHSSNLWHNAWAGTLSRSLVELTQDSTAFPDAARVFLSNSGTEANEAAIKFARRHARALDPSGKKIQIVSFHGSFHGRTFGALSATPNEKYREPFGPMLEGFKTGNFNDVAGVHHLVGEDTAGVIVEPIQGEGGINVATPEFLRELRNRCNEVGAVLIFDEIQCGLRRTGSFWAHRNPVFRMKKDTQNPYTFPDILTSAKALGNGMPIGATITTENVAQHIKPGDHGTTFGGNPLAAAVAQYVIKRLICKDVEVSVNARATSLRAQLEKLGRELPQAIKEIRGCGLMLGIQLTERYAPKIGDVVKYARDNGLLVLTAGTGVIRLLPPLLISQANVDQGLVKLELAIRKVVNETDRETLAAVGAAASKAPAEEVKVEEGEAKEQQQQ